MANRGGMNQDMMKQIQQLQSKIADAQKAWTRRTWRCCKT